MHARRLWCFLGVCLSAIGCTGALGETGDASAPDVATALDGAEVAPVPGELTLARDERVPALRGSYVFRGRVVDFEAAQRPDGEVAAWYLDRGTSERVVVSLRGRDAGVVEWRGRTFTGRGAIDATGLASLSSLAGTDLGLALTLIPMEIGCREADEITDALRAALVIPGQTLYKYAPEYPEPTLLDRASSCRYLRSDAERANRRRYPTPLGLGLDRDDHVPFVMGYFTLDAEGVVARMVPLTHEMGICNSGCRGACGSDCPDTCDHTATRLCERDSAGAVTGRLRTDETWVCGSHDGCRTHDGCYDDCNLEAGGSNCGLGFYLSHCHRACDFDCVWQHGFSTCNEWRVGRGPFDARARFTHSSTLSCEMCREAPSVAEETGQCVVVRPGPAPHPTCGGGMEWCVAASRCVDLRSDTDHCGACGRPCNAPPPTTCDASGRRVWSAPIGHCESGACAYQTRAESCPTGQHCEGAGNCVANCTPTTCAALGRRCGPVSDGCGSSLACGSCPSGQTCNTATGQCATVCVATSCGALGRTCGSIGDGCGGTLSCGRCATGQTCDATTGRCVTTCAPATCASLGRTCGAASDGCGRTLACGSCPTGQACSATTGRCATTCTPATCASLGRTCGAASDGCGVTLACGGCATGQTCNTATGRCVMTCAPATCASLGRTCARRGDGCGRTLACGSCPTGQACSATTGRCVTTCAPATCASLRRTCGAASDGCGATLACGSCPSGTLCNAAGTSCDVIPVCTNGATMACVSGMPGLCSAGQRACVGGAWGACTATVSPRLRSATTVRTRTAMGPPTKGGTTSCRPPSLDSPRDGRAYTSGSTARILWTPDSAAASRPYLLKVRRCISVGCVDAMGDGAGRLIVDNQPVSGGSYSLPLDGRFTTGWYRWVVQYLLPGSVECAPMFRSFEVTP